MRPQADIPVELPPASLKPGNFGAKPAFQSGQLVANPDPVLRRMSLATEEGRSENDSGMTAMNVSTLGADVMPNIALCCYPEDLRTFSNWR